MRRHTPAITLFLLIGCSSSPPTLADERAPVGVACSSFGPSTHSGVWGGRSDWTCGTPMPDLEAAAYRFENDGQLHFGVCNAGGFGSAEACSFAAEIHFRVEGSQIGVHAVDGDGVRVVSASDGNEAVEGEIELLGYDPLTGRLCGRYDVVMEDGFTMRGELNAVEVCSP